MWKSLFDNRHQQAYPLAVHHCRQGNTMKVLSLPTSTQPRASITQTIVRVVQNAVTLTKSRTQKKLVRNVSSMTPAELRSAISKNGCGCGGHCSHCNHIFRDIFPQQKQFELSRLFCPALFYTTSVFTQSDLVNIKKPPTEQLLIGWRWTQVLQSFLSNVKMSV